MVRAVVIGCSNYIDPKIGDLQFAHNDAVQFAETLKEYCGIPQSEVLLRISPGEPSADRGNIYQALLEMTSKPADIVFFYFSGHGFRSLKDGRDYLLPCDAIFGDLEFNAISLDVIISKIQQCRARCAVLLIDACRNFARGGKAVQAESLSPLDPSILSIKGVAAFFSCMHEQRSYEAKKLGAGIFTSALIEGIGDTGRCRTVRELDKFLNMRVSELSREYQKPVQTPLIRVEPLEMAEVCIVSRERFFALGKKSRLNSELRQSVAMLESGIIEKILTQFAAIDIGSSNSLCVFPTIDNRVHFITAPNGRRHHPSAILVWPNMDYEVGQHALDKENGLGTTLLTNYKRLIATNKALCVNGSDIDASDLITATTSSLIRLADESLGTKIETVLAAVPASFSLLARGKFAQAITRSGVRLMRLISEPCAAALCGFHELIDIIEQPINFSLFTLVIDIGGGTTDISVVEVSHIDGEIQIEVHSAIGICDVAGADFDSCLIQIIKQRVHEKAIQCKLIVDQYVEHQILREAERVKIRLGNSDQTSVVLSNLESPAGLQDLEILISREDFVDASAQLVESIRSCIMASVEDAHLSYPDCSWDTINAVVLAGLGCKIWPVRQLIQEISGKRKLITRFEESAVAIGLANYVSVLCGLNKKLLLLDIITSKISIECKHIIIESRLPIRFGQPSGVRAVLSAKAGENNKSLDLIKHGTCIPTFNKVYLSLVDPSRHYSLVVKEAARNGIENVLANLEFDAPLGSNLARFTIDIDANMIVLATLIFYGKNHGEGPKYSCTLYGDFTREDFQYSVTKKFGLTSN